MKKETKAEIKVMNENNILTAEQVELYEKYTTMLGETMREYNKAQLKSGAILAIIFDKELYKVRGFDSIYEYAQNEFMYDGSKGNLSDMINTFKAFGNRETLEVKEEYKDYSFSQLKLMRKLKESDLALVTTATTTRELAEIIKGYKALPQKKEENKTETTETTETENNVSRETSSNVTKEETSGKVEPYIEMTFGITEFEGLDAEEIKQMILECFKSGNDVHLKFKYE